MFLAVKNMVSAAPPFPINSLTLPRLTSPNDHGFALHTLIIGSRISNGSCLWIFSNKMQLIDFSPLVPLCLVFSCDVLFCSFVFSLDKLWWNVPLKTAADVIGPHFVLSVPSISSCPRSESCGSMQMSPAYPPWPLPPPPPPPPPPLSPIPLVLSVVNMFWGCGIPKWPPPPFPALPNTPLPPPPHCWNLTVFSVRLLGFCLFFEIFAAFFCCLKQWCELMSRTKLDVKKTR